MRITEIEAKSVLRKHKKIDSWFISRCGMNIYRGCTHNCVYCDGRSEGYYVPGEFGKDISVKINAPEVVRKELDPERKRIPFPGGYIMIGGGVCDSYQPVEQEYRLCRQILEIISSYEYPVHILTKSTLVRRDTELIQEIHKKSGAIVSFSFSSTNAEYSSQFEPGVPSPDERLNTITFLKSKGIPCGMFLLPVIPFITDSADILEQSVKDGKQAGADFIIFGGMTLKAGKQKEYFLNTIKNYHPRLMQEYESIYFDKKWGQPTNEYAYSLYKLFYQIAKKHNIQIRIPINLYPHLLTENDLVIVILEHLDSILKIKGNSSPFGYAAYSISKLNVPLSEYKSKLCSISGVGTFTEKIILEILETGNSSYLQKIIGES